MNWKTKGRGFRSAGVLMVCGLMLCALSSCSLFSPPAKIEKEPPKILNPVGVSQGMIAVDIRRVRIRYEQRQLLEDFWNDDGTSDQVIPIELRRRLADEGIRIGIQGRSLSPTLARLLELDEVQLAESTGRTAERASDSQNMFSSELRSEEMLLEPLVTKHLFTLSALHGKALSINTYDDPLPQAVLLWDQGGLCGQTYPKAQGTIVLSAVTSPNGSEIRFDLLPVLEYGDTKQTSRVINGNYIHETSRDKLVYDPLKMSIKLLPGQWLVIGPTSPNPLGIGKPFFTRDRGQPEQRIMVFRLTTE